MEAPLVYDTESLSQGLWVTRILTAITKPNPPLRWTICKSPLPPSRHCDQMRYRYSYSQHSLFSLAEPTTQPAGWRLGPQLPPNEPRASAPGFLGSGQFRTFSFEIKSAIRLLWDHPTLISTPKPGKPRRIWKLPLTNHTGHRQAHLEFTRSQNVTRSSDTW